MATYRHEGEALNLDLTSALASNLGCGDELESGDIVVLNNLVMVIKSEIKTGSLGAGHIVGVFNLSASEIDDVADAGDVDMGEEVFLDVTADNIYTTGDDVPNDVFFGYAAADGDTTDGVDVVLKQRGEVVMET